jgi:hypothetical protein
MQQTRLGRFGDVDPLVRSADLIAISESRAFASDSGSRPGRMAGYPAGQTHTPRTAPPRLSGRRRANRTEKGLACLLAGRNAGDRRAVAGWYGTRDAVPLPTELGFARNGRRTMVWTRTTDFTIPGPADLWIAESTGGACLSRPFASLGHTNEAPDVTIYAGVTWVTWTRDQRIVVANNSGGTFHSRTFGGGNQSTIAVSGRHAFVAWFTADRVVLAELSGGDWTSGQVAGARSLALRVLAQGAKARVVYGAITGRSMVTALKFRAVPSPPPNPNRSAVLNLQTQLEVEAIAVAKGADKSAAVARLPQLVPPARVNLIDEVLARISRRQPDWTPWPPNHHLVLELAWRVKRVHSVGKFKDGCGTGRASDRATLVDDDPGQTATPPPG